jgi:hypothetical protein
MEPFDEKENEVVFKAIEILEGVKENRFKSGFIIEGFELTFINKKTGESHVIKI